jgi:hypothetical protein
MNPFCVKICVTVKVNGSTPQASELVRPLDGDAPLDASLGLPDPWLARQLGHGS